MKHPFNTLSKNDVEYLRRQDTAKTYSGQGVSYNFTPADVDGAVRHLKTLYIGKVERTFAARVLLLNELY